MEETEVSSHARQSERSEEDWQRCLDWINLGDAVAFRGSIFLNPEAAIHVVAHGEAGVLRGDDPAHCSGPHHLADADRRDVGAALVHPAPHRWVERDIKDFDQELAIAWFGDRLLGQAPVAALGKADRPGGKPELMIDGAHGGPSPEQQ